MVWCCLAPRHLEPPCSNRPASHIRITSDIMFMTNIGIHGEVYKSFHKMLWVFYHYGDIARAPILFKSPDTWLLVEKLLHDNSNESSNVRISGPLWGKSHLSDSKPQNIVTCNHKNMPSLQWRHSERDGLSNHRPIDSFLNRLFRHRSKKTSKLRVTGLCEQIPLTKTSNAGNVSIWWRHHVMSGKL